MNNRYVVSFGEIDKSSLPYVGGKGANLGEMSKAGFPIPPGFCITTTAYRDFLENSGEMNELFTELDRLNVEQLEDVRTLGERIRSHVLTLPIPQHLEQEIVAIWQQIGSEYSFAVRSSATAEDLPTASFAGQQDTYLNIRGKAMLLTHIRKCWASLFTDRAITYRTKNGFDHRKVWLSVVIQRMVIPDVSGILFTADPISGNRNVTSIDASFGLGEALVSGLVTPDLYQVKHNQIIKKQVAEKKLAIVSRADGGTETIDLLDEKRGAQALTDEQILQVAAIGERIERHYGIPQDIEWCLANGEFFIVQSRPITSLYPVPTFADQYLHVLFSFGHQQNMVNAMKPLGMSAIRTVAPFGKGDDVTAESSFVVEAGNRLYLDLTRLLHRRLPRRIVPIVLKNVDERGGAALQEVVNRKEFLQGAKSSKESVSLELIRRLLGNVMKNVWIRDPKTGLAKANRLIKHTADEMKKRLEQQQGAAKIRVIQETFHSIPLQVHGRIMHYYLAAIVSLNLIKKCATKWLGDVQSLFDDLVKSNQGNVVSEMGLELADLADQIRNFPEIMSYLERAKDDDFYKGLQSLNGGQEINSGFDAFMKKYGMRGSGEIDMTTPRWRETPTQLVGAILGHIRSLAPGEHRVHFQQGEARSKQAEQTILARVRQTRGGSLKAKFLTRLFNVYREYGGMREHGKYMIVICLDIAKQVIMQEAKGLVTAGTLERAEDVFYLSLPELAQILSGSSQLDVGSLIAQRKQKLEHHQKLTPPRVMTSEGEIVTGAYQVADAPTGALLGSPVSAGVIEGRARIVLRPEDAKIEKGEILVAPFTDPGWTPLFLPAKGLVIEVGGLMTHGAVVAREYGIPAVVGIDGATEKIKDGQWIRVNGNRGYVEILEESK